MAKKGKRVLFAWLCKECNRTNYQKESHKDTIPTVLSKYCPQCKCHRDHKSKDKLK